MLGCSAGEAPPDGSVRGELRIANLSFDDGHSQREFYLAAPGTEELTRLVFPGTPELSALTNLKVWGGVEAENLLVERYEVDPTANENESGKIREPLLNGMKETRTVGFMIMNVGGTPNLTVDQARTAAFGTRGANNASLKEYYLEASYNTLDFTGEVFQTNVSIPSGCSTSQLMQIANGWQTEFGMFDHWMGYIGSRSSECGWGGVGWEGNASRAQRVSFYNASNSCVVLAQEIGHNLGWMHAGTMDCGNEIMPDDPSECEGTEYGSRISPMGGACLHLNAYDKWYQGFFGGCNGVRVPSTGVFTLLPIEIPCDGVQALNIPMPKSRVFRNTSGNRDTTISRYYLELRTKRGLDNKSAIPGPRVFVHVVGDVPQPTQTATFDWVLDMVPETEGYDGMNVGQTFTDPAGGVSFTVQAMDNDRATIAVNIANGSGSPTCMDNTTFVAPGPSTCGTGGMGGMGGMAGTGGMGGASGAGMGGVPGAGMGGMPGAGTAGMAGGMVGGAGSGGDAGGGGLGGMPSAGSGGAPVTGGAGAGISGSAGAGISGSGGSSAGVAGAPTVAGAAGSGPIFDPVGPGAIVDDPSGCGCRTARPARGASALWAFSLVALGLLRRRRSFDG
jgi:MYXO-CTERM domain-containing protein